MTIEYINRAYGINAAIGKRVRYSQPSHKPREGTIVGTHGAYLRIKMDSDLVKDYKPCLYHPTWCMEILD